MYILAPDEVAFITWDDGILRLRGCTHGPSTRFIVPGTEVQIY